MTTNHIAAPALVFNGVEIHDRNEMLCLTDMWHAAGEPEHKRPAEWARKEGAGFIEFIAETHNMAVGHIMKTQRGKGGATFAHWQIGLAYAKYLSPEFHMWCNTVVRERMEGKPAGVLPPEVLEMIRRDDGISRMLAHKVTEQGKALAVISEAVNALVAIVQPSVPGVVIRHGRTAGAILKANGFVGCPKNLAVTVGNWLEAAGCRVEGHMDTGVCRARLFDPDKAEAWFRAGGKQAVERKLAERKGQGVLPLAGGNVVSFGAHTIKDSLLLSSIFADACCIVNDMVKRGEVSEAGSPQHEYFMRLAFASAVVTSGMQFPRVTRDMVQKLPQPSLQH